MSRPRAFRDPDVLTRAMLAFWQQGYAGSSLPSLEQATGLRTSSLYNRFGSKEGLFAEVLQHYLEKVVGWRIRRYLQDLDPVAGLRRFLESSHDYIDLGAGRLPVACLLTNTALEFGHRDPQVAAAITAGLERVEAGFADCLRRARAQGRLAATADVDALARQLLLGLQGLLVLSKVNPDPVYLRQSTAALLAALPFNPRQGVPDESPAHA